MEITQVGTDGELGRRALAAYFRSGNNAPADAEVVRLQGRRYVRLRVGGNTRTVYRVRGDGALRKMRRPPAEVAPGWAGFEAGAA